MKNYDLYLIEFEDYYERLEKLFLFKRKLLEEYYSNYGLESDIPYIDNLLMNKILEMTK